MDTRTKIIGADRLAELAAQGAQIVSGHFDPLVASMAEHVAALKRDRPDAPLAVLLRSSQDPILPAHARAELVAALAVVDYVCCEESDIQADFELDLEHGRRLIDLIAHVHGRNSTSSQGSPR